MAAKVEVMMRKVDDLGRVVIPKEIRERHGIKEGTPVQFKEEGNIIMISRSTPTCMVCGSKENPLLKGTTICAPCAELLLKTHASTEG